MADAKIFLCGRMKKNSKKDEFEPVDVAKFAKSSVVLRKLGPEIKHNQGFLRELLELRKKDKAKALESEGDPEESEEEPGEEEVDMQDEPKELINQNHG